MMSRKKLKDAVKAKWQPIYATSRADVIAHAQETYGTAWKSELAMRIAGTTDKKSRAYKSASREFQLNKRTGLPRYLGEKPSAATQVKYEAVGKQLPPIGKILPGNTITITVTGRQFEKRGMQREREWTVTFHGPDAYDFAAHPDYWTFFGQMDYSGDVVEAFDGEDSSGVEVTHVA